MTERFEPDETPETMRAVFTKMAQQSGEELREFAARVKKIGSKAFQYCPSFVIEQECITKFISGISNKKAAEGFSFHKFEHLKDALEAVRSYLNRNCPESVVTRKVRYAEPEQAEGNGDIASASGGDPGGGKEPRGTGDGNSSPGTPEDARGRLRPQNRGAPEGDRRAAQENPRSRGDRWPLD
ncbi:hypothetical protein BaRGS_00001055, partial [Batillaria attramentaria]